MNCPTIRGGCGRVLRWTEGAFCDDCVRAAVEKMQRDQREQLAKKRREREAAGGGKT